MLEPPWTYGTNLRNLTPPTVGGRIAYLNSLEMQMLKFIESLFDVLVQIVNVLDRAGKL